MPHTSLEQKAKRKAFLILETSSYRVTHYRTFASKNHNSGFDNKVGLQSAITLEFSIIITGPLEVYITNMATEMMG